MFNLFRKKNDNGSTYRFRVPQNSACFVCDHVLNKLRPILHVTHDDDGYWQFLCGQNDHDVSNGKIISMKEASEIDNAINDLFEMPLGVGAGRKTIHDKWEPFKFPPIHRLKLRGYRNRSLSRHSLAK